MKIKLKPHIICGYIATLIYCIMLLPQLYKSITTKSVDDISIFFLYLLLIGTILRLYYSYTIKAWPIIISNIFNICITISMIIIYYTFSR